MKFLNLLLISAYFIFVFSFTCLVSTDLNQDLGRHLKMGEIITQTYSVPKTNLFSYTNQNFEFINHHWFGEVIFYNLTQIFGLNSLLFLKVFLLLSSLTIVVLLSLQKNSVISTVITASIFSPLLLERIFIRPEQFGYLFFAFLLFILFSYPKYSKLLYFIPFVMLLWVNIHVTFIFGVGLIGLLFIKIWVIERKKLFSNYKLMSIFGLSAIALFLNPNGIKGALYPLFIFSNYGYPIVENQNIFFLSFVTNNINIGYFFLLSPVVFISIIILLIKKKYLDSFVLSLFFLLPFFQIRHMPFLIFCAIATVPIVIDDGIKIIQKYIKDINYLLTLLWIPLCLFASIFFYSNQYQSIFDKDTTFGAGFHENVKPATEFMKRNKLPQPIFNNFDIGGYAIYSLYPEYKMFVDNRPEAYPSDFLQNVYIGLQNNPQLRDEVFKKYNIQTIFFTQTDQTPWGQQFIIDILKVKEWKLVYVDSFMMIFTKDSKFKDIRNDTAAFKKLIDNTKDYLTLLRLAQTFQTVGNDQLFLEAFSKASDLNPSSCAVKQTEYYQYKQNPVLFYKADDIRKSNWFCFKST